MPYVLIVAHLEQQEFRSLDTYSKLPNSNIELLQFHQCAM